LNFVQATEVRMIEVLDLPLRRGPASEAQMCYRDPETQAETLAEP
jgi:ribosomal 50S subunit-recycling heat shock protein